MQHQTLACCGGVRASLPPPLSFRWSKIKFSWQREGGRRLPRCARIAAQLELKPPPYSLVNLTTSLASAKYDFAVAPLNSTSSSVCPAHSFLIL
ncbi:hypothetical protein BHE74_00054669 [Ensete ventricosum]|nr:hypothetical protein BHE74_00054669 [Ensete ventricosum]